MTTDTTIETSEVLQQVLEEQERIVTEEGGFRELPRKSLVRHGDTELPERVQVWDRFGKPSMVPTAALAYHLNKKDRDGNRVFFSKRPAGVPEETFIEETCKLCLKRGVRKRFPTKYDHRGHMESYHPRELAVDREEKQEQQQAAGIFGALAGMTDEQKALLRELLAEKPARKAAKE